jgi:membrane dipeptidase
VPETTAEHGLLPIFDGHNDVLLALYGGLRRTDRRSFFERASTGHLDLPRAREGGFAGGFFAVYVPPDPAARRPPLRWETPPSEEAEWAVLPPAVEHTFALRMAMSLTATLFRLEEESAGELEVVRDAVALRRCLEAGTIAAILHFEGAEAIDPELNALDVFHRAGLRSLGLVWSRPNAFAEGVPFRFPSSPDTGPGLTAAGRDLVQECNRLGILIDLSHLNERGFWDVAELSDAPLVATHSNAHAVTPTTRNLTDAQLDAVRDSGGVVGVNFAVSFSREDGRNEADTPLEALVRHFSHLCERMGTDHVAFGSDFDGTTVPTELGDAAGLPRLVEALRRAGFGEAELRKLGTENWLRVLERTWKSPTVPAETEPEPAGHR